MYSPFRSFFTRVYLAYFNLSIWFHNYCASPIIMEHFIVYTLNKCPKRKKCQKGSILTMLYLCYCTQKSPKTPTPTLSLTICACTEACSCCKPVVRVSGTHPWYNLYFMKPSRTTYKYKAAYKIQNSLNLKKLK